MTAYPRALSAAEEALLQALLSYDFPGAAELRSQLPSVRVRGLSLDDPHVPLFEVADPKAPRAQVSDIVPIQARVRDADPPIEILLFVKDGLLDSLEVVDYGSKTRRPLPGPDEIGSVWLRGVFDGWRPSLIR